MPKVSIILTLHNQQIQVKDCKLFTDIDTDTLTNMGVFSVSDSIINNKNYPNINKFLESFEKSQFEQ